MTHGIGGISHGGGGGGGGFSGGGWGATTITHVHTSSSRRRGSNGANNADDSCALCWLIGFLLCLVKMPSKTRVILTWIYVIVAIVVSGVLIAKHHGSRSISVSPSDERFISPQSVTFCQSMVLDYYQLIDYFVFEKEPDIITNNRTYVTKSVSSCVWRDTYEFWGFYMLSGSDLGISFTSDIGYMTFYLIKGDGNFNKWKDNSDCDDCYLVKRQWMSDSFNYSIPSSDQYYAVYANDDLFVRQCSIVSATFRLNRTQYDLSSGVKQCSQNFDCTVDINLVHPQTVVVQIPDYASFDSDINVYCTPRAYMYFMICGLCPAVIGLAITIVVLKLWKRKFRRQRRDSLVHIVSNDERMHGFANDSASVGPSPPTYEASQQTVTPTAPPPSYEKAMTAEAGKKQHRATKVTTKSATTGLPTQPGATRTPTQSATSGVTTKSAASKVTSKSSATKVTTKSAASKVTSKSSATKVTIKSAAASSTTKSAAARVTTKSGVAGQARKDNAAKATHKNDATVIPKTTGDINTDNEEKNTN
ncbi:uncharacterized protein LOC128219110 [Mya arenaria]|uniref:uncharacterized protein LOC128219110 n=1 Tax=Mya arenaria TaxID=6604 RepID=UPI0022E90CFC|nr:uncharacterized protein LOC128219110 [Mya arenaria]